MKIEDFPIDQITPYEFNNRRHDKIQIERIAKSIKEFGFNQPIVIDENNECLVGHGRLLAAQHLGFQFVPVYKKSNLSEVQKKAYRILDNKLQNDSLWDFDNLNLELDSLEDSGLDLADWGLDSLKEINFEPGSIDDQGKLDEPKQAECPECGHRFTP